MFKQIVTDLIGQQLESFIENFDSNSIHFTGASRLPPAQPRPPRHAPPPHPSSSSTTTTRPANPRHYHPRIDQPTATHPPPPPGFPSSNLRLKHLPVLTRASRGLPHCAYGLRVPASCVLYVPEAQGSLHQPRACRAYRVPWRCTAVHRVPCDTYHEVYRAVYSTVGCTVHCAPCGAPQEPKEPAHRAARAQGSLHRAQGTGHRAACTSPGLH